MARNIVFLNERRIAVSFSEPVKKDSSIDPLGGNKPGRGDTGWDFFV